MITTVWKKKENAPKKSSGGKETQIKRQELFLKHMGTDEQT